MRYASIIELTKALSFRPDVRYKARVAERQGLTIVEVPFSEFREFYCSIVSVKKTDETWKTLESMFFTCLMAKMDDVPISGAAFSKEDTKVYYGMAASNFSSPYSKRAGYLLQTEAAMIFKERGFEMYVVGLLADDDDAEKLKNISAFKKQFGDLFLVEGEKFPFDRYVRHDDYLDHISVIDNIGISI